LTGKKPGFLKSGVFVFKVITPRDIRVSGKKERCEEK